MSRLTAQEIDTLENEMNTIMLKIRFWSRSGGVTMTERNENILATYSHIADVCGYDNYLTEGGYFKLVCRADYHQGCSIDAAGVLTA